MDISGYDEMDLRELRASGNVDVSGHINLTGSIYGDGYGIFNKLRAKQPSSGSVLPGVDIIDDTNNYVLSSNFIPSATDSEGNDTGYRYITSYSDVNAAIFNDNLFVIAGKTKNIGIGARLPIAKLHIEGYTLSDSGNSNSNKTSLLIKTTGGTTNVRTGKYAGLANEYFDIYKNFTYDGTFYSRDDNAKGTQAIRFRDDGSIQLNTSSSSGSVEPSIAMFIGGDGKVCVGNNCQTVPYGMFEVNGSLDHVASFTSTGNNSYIRFRTGGTSLKSYIGYNAGRFEISNYGGEQTIIWQNLGVGAQSSGFRLNVGGTGNFTSKLGINNPTLISALSIKQISGTPGQGNLDNTTRNYTAISISRYNTDTYTWRHGVNTGDDLIWYVDNDEKMYLRQEGNDVNLNFTGQHRCIMNNNITSDYVGLIVSFSNNYINLDNGIKPTVNDSLPYCVLTSTDNDSKVFGVISDKEDGDTRDYNIGNIGTVHKKKNINENRLYINSVGEGGIWVCNKNGNLSPGDYIVSTTVTGYGGKQSDDILRNYTIAKVTCKCDFSLVKIPKQKLKVITTNVQKTKNKTHIVQRTQEKEVIEYDENLQRYVKKIITETYDSTEYIKETFDLYDEEGNIIGTHDVNVTENVVEINTEIAYDVNGDVQFEDDLDEEGNQQMVYPLDTRFLLADGTILADENEYNTRLSNGEDVYIACFVGCTYHSG